ncbi:hypothetical protein ACQEU5_13710 [Marinactinospora thermotolerans]|nr:hypothetical protein [Marinactinospora thermotolerans]
MCDRGTTNADTSDKTYIFDPDALTTAQLMGDACAICHVRWPRPRCPLGELPDGSGVYGCDECAGIAVAHATRARAFAMH